MADPPKVPHLVRRLVPVALAFVALALPSGAMAAAEDCANATAIPSASNVGQVRAATLCLLNSERAAHGLAPLAHSAQLGSAARSHSTRMVRLRFFDHVCPRGSTLVSRVRKGTSYLSARVRRWGLAENISWGTGQLATAERVVQAWMQSPKHRRNILDRRFRHIGIGVALGAPRDVSGRSAATYTTDFGYRAAG